MSICYETHTTKKNELTVQLLINKRQAQSLRLYLSEYNTAVEKLSKHAYDSWKLQIETILMKTDHWNFVTRDETKPGANEQKLRNGNQVNKKLVSISSYQSIFQK
ncbi:hypothetical protein CDAR_469801 [Caerostris darwini]|uniref:Uncharacterized protein n=1 Tax=Caerostris darwini TaxID=1538125 RepID=A0AAV4TZE0_9ARAC|nr:hypothetical protein CDAR_469801 [Caerostris darwini]